MRFEGRSGGSGGFGGRRFGGGGGGRRFGGGGGFRDRRPMSDEPKPVKVGEEYDVEISETGSRGDGIARVNNFVVFVNGAKQGEKLKIKITDVRDRFAIGQKAGAEDAPVEQSMAGTDDMGDASDATESTVKEDLGDDEGSDGEDAPDEGSDDDEEQ